MTTYKHGYEGAVITDKSGTENTANYYDHWADKGLFKDTDARSNAAGPISDKLKSHATCSYYGAWSPKYEEDMMASGYNGPRLVADAFLELKLEKNIRMLDLLAGTGKVAKLIRPHGYTNLDAIDGSADMLERSKEQGLYCNYIQSLIGRGHTTPIDNETYDVIISSGSFGPGHLYSDVFPELLRITKKGGLICWSMRQGYEMTSPAFISFEDDVTKLIEDGVWEFYKPRIYGKEYLLGSDGWVYIMKKL